VGAIGRRLFLTPDFTSDPPAVLGAIRAVLATPDDDRMGPSPIWDAVHLAVQVLESEPGWRHVIVVTDGLASGNLIGSAAAAERAVRAGVAVHMIETGWLTESPFPLPRGAEINAMKVAARALLRGVATDTGGSHTERPFVPPARAAQPEIGVALQHLFDALHAGYEIRIGSAQLHRGTAVEIRIPARLDVTVRATPVAR